MNQKVYIQLFSMMKSDLHKFVLEENNDSEYTKAVTTR